MDSVICLFMSSWISGSDTRLLGFYAVNKTTNEVFSADRNSWGGVSSREYQDATGEN